MTTQPAKPTESVWDYPRPPALDASGELVEVDVAGRTIVSSTRPIRVLETSQAPAYYLPFDDVVPGVLEQTEHRTFCEWKGVASYFDVVVDGQRRPNAAWTYPDPAPGFEAIRDHVAFYPQRVDACRVDGEVVSPNDGDFYGGWITSRVTGPFKGAPGTRAW